MFPRKSPEAGGKNTLAIFNHRGDDLRDLGRMLEKSGFRVVTSNNPEETAQVIARETLKAAIVVPLTLSSSTLEWEELLPKLSPKSSVPWLILPWQDAQPMQVSELLHGKMALADWLMSPFTPQEAEARICNLLRFQELITSSQEKSEHLAAQLIVDHKTELSNDRHFRSRLVQEFSRCQRHNNPLALLLLDIDDFKQINDNASYEFGDTVLRTIAEIIRHSVRNIDISARIGGDEYAVLMPDTDLEAGVGVASRILSTADGLVVNDQKYQASVHLSIGVASFSGEGLTDSSQLFLQANEALKAAKSAGKNRVYFFDPKLHSPTG